MDDQNINPEQRPNQIPQPSSANPQDVQSQPRSSEVPLASSSPSGEPQVSPNLGLPNYEKPNVKPTKARSRLIIIGFIVLVIFLVAGYLVTKHSNTNKTNPRGTPRSQPVKTSTSSSTSGWKTFNWTYEGLTIKYPSTWTTYNPQVPINQRQSLGANDPFFTLYSPNISTQKGYSLGSDPNNSDTYTGSFSVELSVAKPSDNQCNAASNSSLPNSPDPDYIVNIIPFSVPNYKSMNIIEDGGTTTSTAAELALTDQPVKLGVTIAPYLQDTYASKKYPGQYACIEAGFFAQPKNAPDNFSYVILPKATFENMTDYSTVLNIMKSVSY